MVVEKNIENFNWKNYIQRYSDLKGSGVDTKEKAIKHYLTRGQVEKRSDFDHYDLKITRLPEDRLVYKTTTPHPSLPKTVDLRNKFPGCYDQVNLVSSTTQAVLSMYQYILPTFKGSRLFQYYNERTIHVDPEITVANTIKAAEVYGICEDIAWRCNINNFGVKPSQNCYSLATQHKILPALHIKQDLKTMQEELANGFPFIIGFTVYSSFESPQVTRTGIVPMPGPSDTILGGYCVVVVGYTPLYWICRNNQGTAWGNNGYFYIPLAYLTHPELCSDIFIITEINKI